MNNPNFGSILDRPATSAERPKAIPVGTYLWIVKGLPRYDKSAKKGTEFVEFTMQCQQASDDVDEEALTAALTRADGEMKALTDITQRYTFYLTEDAIWRLRKFLDDCKIANFLDKNGNSVFLDERQVEKGGGKEELSHRQRIDLTPNAQVWGTIKHTASDDGTTVFANISGTAPVED